MKNNKLLTDEIVDIAYDDFDAMEIEYSLKETYGLREIIVRNSTSMKKPLILSGTNAEAISHALRIYPGIAGIRKSTGNDYGAIVI